jgi:tetratricopeptide (TPR) repeat protein
MSDSAFASPLPSTFLNTRTVAFWRAKQLGEIARAYRFWGFYDSAMVYHRRSLETFTRGGSPLPDVDAANQCEGIGLVYAVWGVYDSARQYLLLSKKAREVALDWLGVGACYDGLGQVSLLLGNYFEAVTYLNSALQCKLKHRIHSNNQRDVSYKESLSITHLLLGKVYGEWGFTKTAMREFNASLELCREISFASGQTAALNESGKLCLRSGNTALAEDYFSQAMKRSIASGDKPGQATVLKYRGDIRFAAGNYPMALRLYHQAMKIAGITGDPVEQAELGLRIGKTLKQSEKPDEAFKYLTRALAVAQRLKLQKTVIDALTELSTWHQKNGEFRQAFMLLKQAVSLKDSVSAKKTGFILADMDARRIADQNTLKIRQITGEKMISELNIQRFHGLLATIVVVSVMIAFLLALMFRHHKSKGNYRIALLQHRLFSAQLNPEVIFGGLNDIRTYLNLSQYDSAEKYLARFSRYLQTTLHGSRNLNIPLGKEIVQLSNYLEIQQMCHPGSFQFILNPPVSAEPDEILVPPFLIQPFVEKAVVAVIECGQKNRRITIRFECPEKSLVVTVEDNGTPWITATGMIVPADERSAKTISMIHDRLELLWGKPGKRKFLCPSATVQQETGEHINRVELIIPVSRL